jgi:hypothetical protein
MTQISHSQFRIPAFLSHRQRTSTFDFQLIFLVESDNAMARRLCTIALLGVMTMMNVESSACFMTFPQTKRCSHSPVSMALVERTEKKKTNAATREENPRLTGLALMLDDGTRKSHSVAQNSAFVSGFFKGLSTREAYKALITSLYFVYSAMEQAFDDPMIPSSVSALDDAELRRLSALEKDMDYFYGGKWRETIQPSSATKTYVARIRKVAAKQPHLLIAHQYTRYLGDLLADK